jgi:hypothetical protein
MAPKTRPRPPAEHIRERNRAVQKDLSRRTGGNINSARRPPKKTGKLRGVRTQPLSPAAHRETEARTSRMHDAVGKELARIPSEDLGGADKNELLGRVKRTLKRKRIENFSSSRLARSKGLKWQLLGAVNEDVIACNKGVWNQIGEFASQDLATINKRLQEHGGTGLVNGKGNPIVGLEGLPTQFPKKVEIATDVWLVPESTSGGAPDLKKIALNPEAHGGLQFTDRVLASFAGPEGARWMANGADVEIKVPLQAPELGPQTKKAQPRRASSGYLVASIEDSKGNVVRREVVAVDRIVLNPGSTTSYGATTSRTGLGRFKLSAPPGRGGLKEMHWRTQITVRIRIVERILDAMLSHATLFGKKGRK